MTETKYILTGDEPHWSGEAIREVYCGVKFPRTVNYDGKGFNGSSDVYCNADNPHDTYYVDAGTHVKEAAVGKVEYVFRGGSLTIKPVDVNWDAAKSLFDPVEKPEHYTKGMPEGVEVIDVIRSQGWESNFYLANAAKYLLRCEHKGNKRQDLEKMMQFVRWELDRLDG